jgi:imidazolonepropionase-like amidohydrolase
MENRNRVVKPLCSYIELYLSLVVAVGIAGLCFPGNRANAAAGEGGEPRYFAITNARIVRVSEPVIESGTVVIAKGLIEGVGTTLSIPPEAWVIDGKGLTVYPGFIDAGSTVGLGDEAGDGKGKKAGPNATSPEDRPGTTLWRATADEVKIDDKRIESWRSAGFTTTLALPEGGIFPGQAAVLDLAGNRPGDFVVRPMAAVPISFKPVGGFFGFPDSLMGTIGYVRQVVDDTNWYSQAEPIYQANPTKNERLPYDRAERTLSAAIREKEVVLLAANNSIQILRALRLAAEWKFSPVLFGGQQGYAVVDEIAANKSAVLVSLKWPERPKDADPDAPQTLRELRFRDRAPGTPAALAKANVKFGFYSEGLSTPKDIFNSLKRAMDAGLTSDAAIRALTLDAADILGLGDRMGSVSPGKIANLIVTDGDIFNEKTKVKHVFVDGQWFEIHDGAKPEKAGEKGPADDEDSDGDVSHIQSQQREGVGR